jgi:hypothetical protein
LKALLSPRRPPPDLPAWLRGSYDVAHAFDGVSSAPVRRDDIVEVAQDFSFGELGIAPCAFVRLADRRWAAIARDDAETGGGAFTVVGASRDRVERVWLGAAAGEPPAGVPEWVARWPPWIPMTAFDGASSAPVVGLDVVEVACHFEEHHGEVTREHAIVKLRDGRWAALTIHAYSHTRDPIVIVAVAPTRKRVWWSGLDDDARDALSATLSREALDEELVEIDELLESEDPEQRALGERRMQRRAGKVL